MTTAGDTFTLPARVLHWLMALLIVAMLFIGVGMVASVSERHEWLLAIHKPLGIAILLLAIVRLAVRLRHPPPPLPADLPALQKLAALTSHWLLYALMLAMPLIGWAMLSAGGYPVMLGSSLRLPPIFPVSPVAFAVLRHLHGWFAMLLFLTFLAHMAAALYHGLIRRDGVLSSMLRGRRKTAPASIGYSGEPAENAHAADAGSNGPDAAERIE
ncbi:cytochrome b [Rhodanobacter glycinis]|uniref:Cytochrome b n=1 Tax=Rhodanobacter glycinis TaxID=582702 RepID=A0A502C5E0_9GAMM|nr:cytochrome b [Rhodanobacter glycinis]TPG08397.1 cytochrome b [Rhodanobacter glycinis]